MVLFSTKFHRRILYFGGYGLAPDRERVDQSNGYFTFNSSGEEQFTVS